MGAGLSVSYNAANLNTNTVVSANPCTINSITFTNSAATANTITLYDSATTNSGTVLWKATLAAGSIGLQTLVWAPAGGIPANSGVVSRSTASSRDLIVVFG